jgi:hypothetical protein
MFRLVHYDFMDIQKIISDVKAHAAKSSRTPESVCRAATGQPRLFERLERRLAQTEKDAKRIYDHMQGSEAGQ